MNVYEEHKNEREARGPERTEREARRSKIPERAARRSSITEREARDENVPAKRAHFFIYEYAIFSWIKEMSKSRPWNYQAT